MKGLIIKDFKLLMMQKSFFVTLTIVAIFFGITTDSIFVIGFLTMICSMFALSTILVMMNLIMAMHFYFHYRLQEKVMLLKSIFLQLCLVLYHLFYQQ